MGKYIAVFNAGSATLKFAIFDKATLRKKTSGAVERIGLKKTFISIDGRIRYCRSVNTHEQALQTVIRLITINKKEIGLIGHRVVHGGELFTKPTVITDNVLKKIQKLGALAPLHNPINVKVINACQRKFPGVKNIAVFDTAFFSRLRPEDYLYALPYRISKQYAIRRYGFHGISHQYVTSLVAEKMQTARRKLNIITIHLGNGCSITAIKKGKPLITSMGFTPLEGLVMGTRSGDIGPAMTLFLQKKLGLSSDKIEEILNKESGLLGISGFTSDMREILKAAGKKVLDYQGRRHFTASQKKQAKLALAVFIRRLKHYIGSYAALLGQVDAIVFTGAMGERSPVIRRLAVEGIQFKKRPRIMTIKTDEALEIAKQAKNGV